VIYVPLAILNPKSSHQEKSPTTAVRLGQEPEDKPHPTATAPYAWSMANIVACGRTVISRKSLY